MASSGEQRMQPVRIQRGNVVPLANKVGSLVLCKYNGIDVPCVKTFQDFINLESPGKYYGIVENQMKTIRFEVKKKIIAVDGEMASYEIKLGKMSGLRKHLCTIAHREAVLSNHPDAYIVSERGESFKAHVVKWRHNGNFGICLERGVREDLPKGCPVYDKENQMIGLIKNKIYGILWSVNWVHASQLPMYEYVFAEFVDEIYDSPKNDYQSILNLSEFFAKDCQSVSDSDSSSDAQSDEKLDQIPEDIAFTTDRIPEETTCTTGAEKSHPEDMYCVNEPCEEKAVESEKIEAKGVAEPVSYAEPFNVGEHYKAMANLKASNRKSCAMQKTSSNSHQCPSTAEILKMSRRMDAITKQLEGITNFFQSIENARTDIQGGKGEVSSDYANLYSSPMRTKKQDSNAAGTVENGNVEESVVESNQSDTVQECHKFVYGNLRIDGKLTKPLKSENESKGDWKNPRHFSTQNEYFILDDRMRLIPQRQKVSKDDSLKKQLWQDFDSDMTINNIDPNTLHELALELDDEEWERLAVQLGVPEMIIKQMKASQCGRCCAAYEFIQNLVTRFPRERLIDFRQKVIEIQRNDVVEFIDSAMYELIMSTLQEIPQLMLQALSNRLEQSQFKSIKYWRHLAGLYGYENHCINSMESTMFGYHKHSPTTALIEYLAKSQPVLSVSQIGISLEKLGLMRISQKLYGMFARKMTYSSMPNLVRYELPPI